jgi:hypothetical protein
MKIFNRNEQNPYNVGSKFKIEVEITRIEKEKNCDISYVFRTTSLQSNSTIYGITINDINKLEAI